MMEIGCPSCKYGVMDEIVMSEVIGKITRIKRKCNRCGDVMSTYKYDDGGHVVGNMPPPKPSIMPDLIGPLRTATGELLNPWEKSDA